MWSIRHTILTILLLLVISLPGYSDGRTVLVTMRKIGHEVLLASGDSTSWVSPIKEVDDRTFLIRFQRPIAFKPASLVEIIYRHLQENQGHLDYLVEVRQEKLNTVAYSYEVRQPLNRRTIAYYPEGLPGGPTRLKSSLPNRRFRRLQWAVLCGWPGFFYRFCSSGSVGVL